MVIKKHCLRIWLDGVAYKCLDEEGKSSYGYDTGDRNPFSVAAARP